MNWILTSEQLPKRGERVLMLLDGHAYFGWISSYGLPLWVMERSMGVTFGTPSHWAAIELPETVHAAGVVNSQEEK